MIKGIPPKYNFNFNVDYSFIDDKYSFWSSSLIKTYFYIINLHSDIHMIIKINTHKIVSEISKK